MKKPQPVMFPLHDIYELIADPSSPEESMFYEIRKLKKNYNDVEAEKLTITFRANSPDVDQKKKEEPKEEMSLFQKLNPFNKKKRTKLKKDLTSLKTSKLAYRIYRPIQVSKNSPASVSRV